MVSEKKFCQNVPQVTLNSFTPHRYFVKIKLSRSKRQLIERISEIEQNDVTNDAISQKHHMILPKCSSDYDEQLFSS